MKSGFRYFCFICASLLATQVFAADMSGWSDKKVFRLVKAGGGQEHIDEATKRGLDCTSPAVKSGAVSSRSSRIAPL
jgi:oligoendopeptidase F